MFVTGVSTCILSMRLAWGWLTLNQTCSKRSCFGIEHGTVFCFWVLILSLSCCTVEAEIKQNCVPLPKKKKKKDKTFFVDKEGAEIYCFKYFLSRKDVAWLWYGAGFTGLQLLLCVMRLFSIAVQCSTESLALLVCVWASGPTATWATGRRNGWLNDVP